MHVFQIGTVAASVVLQQSLYGALDDGVELRLILSNVMTFYCENSWYSRSNMK